MSRSTDDQPARKSLASPKSMGAFLVSLCIHLIFLLSMALVLIGTGGGKGLGIQLFVDASEDSIQAEATQLELSSLLQESQSESQSLQSPEVPQLTVSTKINSIANTPSDYTIGTGEMAPSGASADFAQAAAAAAASGSKEDAPTKDPGYGKGASFFGTYAPGQRFVFVIDSSKSMLDGGRWVTLRRELIRAIKGLSPDQEFFVISFDVAAHPMFDSYPPAGKFLPPTAESIQRLNYWLNGINHGGATLPASSIGLALRLKPDAIFLLSDGEIQDNTVADLRVYNRVTEELGKVKVAIPIHTVLLHSPIGAATLQAIADENDGVFTPVRQFAGR
ncbi:MAG: vWA domain-containing protein [Pirellula sp.]